MIELERTALVWGICGNLGGGKTLTAVRIAVEAMSRGFFVVSNVWINLDRVAAVYGESCRALYKLVDLERDSPFDFPSGDPRGSGGRRRVLVVLDECAEFLDQYSSTSPFTKTFMSWLRHSSKRSQDVFFICQRQEYLAKSVRILVGRWIWVDDLAVWRVPVFKARLPFMGGFISQNVFDRQGSRIQGVSFTKKSFWGQFYNTTQIIGRGAESDVYSVPDVDYAYFPHLVFWAFTVWLLFRA